MTGVGGVQTGFNLAIRNTINHSWVRDTPARCPTPLPFKKHFFHQVPETGFKCPPLYEKMTGLVSRERILNKAVVRVYPEQFSGVRTLHSVGTHSRAKRFVMNWELKKPPEKESALSPIWLLGGLGTLAPCW